jgi:hypothetical protein
VKRFVWHVVGLQRSVRNRDIRQGWNERPVRQAQAQGILVASRRVLAGNSRNMSGRWSMAAASPG